MSAKIDKSQFDRLIKQLPAETSKAWRSSGEHFRDITPKRSGNARRKTLVDKERILANYDYAGRLDDGSSKQAPDGMSDPTIEHFQNEIDNMVRKLNGS